jgi:hypothetical protein
LRGLRTCGEKKKKWRGEAVEKRWAGAENK